MSLKASLNDVGALYLSFLFSLLLFWHLSCFYSSDVFLLLVCCGAYIMIDVSNLLSAVSLFSVCFAPLKGRGMWKPPPTTAPANQQLPLLFFFLSFFLMSSFSLSQLPFHQRDFVLNWDCHMVRVIHPLHPLCCLLSESHYCHFTKKNTSAHSQFQCSGFSLWPLTHHFVKPVGHPEWNLTAFKQQCHSCINTIIDVVLSHHNT